VVLQVSGVTFITGEVQVFTGLTFSVAAGEALAIAGVGGSGKTALTHLLLGLLPSTAGTIRLWDQDVAASSYYNLLRLRQRVGYLPQHPNLLGNLRLWENVALPLLYHRRAARADAFAAAGRLLDWAGVGPWADRLPDEVPMAVQKRACLARAAVLEPELFLLDDPLDGLDPAGSAQMERAVREMAAGRTLLCTTASLPAAMRLAARVAVLAGGTIRLDGPAAAIAQSSDPAVRSLLAEVPG
jgi:ABC-type transporter Mla maintaining outer membrane lipid asymmetry ATPase subunit MlaF